MDVTKTHWLMTGDRKEIKVVVRDAEIEALLTLARQGRNDFSRTLVRKLEAALR